MKKHPRLLLLFFLLPLCSYQNLKSAISPEPTFQLSSLKPGFRLVKRQAGIWRGFMWGLWLENDSCSFLVVHPLNLVNQVIIDNKEKALEYVRFFSNIDSHELFRLGGMVEVVPNAKAARDELETNELTPATFKEYFREPSVRELPKYIPETPEDAIGLCRGRNYDGTRVVLFPDDSVCEVHEHVCEDGYYSLQTKTVMMTVKWAWRLGLQSGLELMRYFLDDRIGQDKVRSRKDEASKEKESVFEGELESNIIKIDIIDSKDEPSDKDTSKEGFSIYVPKIRTPIEELIRKPTSIDLTKIELGNYPLISEQDIISYDPKTQCIEMRDETAKRLLGGRVYAGTFALVCVDRKPIYWALLTTDICEVGFNWITINMPSPIEPNRRTIRIDLPPRPFVGQDPRNNSEIIEAFRRSGKLKKESGFLEAFAGGFRPSRREVFESPPVDR